MQGWWNIEAEAKRAVIDPEMNEPQRHHVERSLHTYYTSLPFSEAERHWFFDSYERLYGVGLLDKLRQQEETIVSDGLPRAVSGRDLLRRWSSWRRQTDEFRGQNTVDIAREALRELVETLSPDLGLPDPYLTLRNSLSPYHEPSSSK